MTKEILKKAIELDKAITSAKEWMAEIRKAESICFEEKYTGRFCLQIVKASGDKVLVDIPANAALEAIRSAHREILKDEERMSNIFKELH